MIHEMLPIGAGGGSGSNSYSEIINFTDTNWQTIDLGFKPSEVYLIFCAGSVNPIVNKWENGTYYYGLNTNCFKEISEKSNVGNLGDLDIDGSNVIKVKRSDSNRTNYGFLVAFE